MGFPPKILILLLTLWVPEFFDGSQLKSILVKFWLNRWYLFTTYRDCHFENWVYPKEIIAWDFTISHSDFLHFLLYDNIFGRFRLICLKYRGPILRVTSPALGSDDRALTNQRRVFKFISSIRLSARSQQCAQHFFLPKQKRQYLVICWIWALKLVT